MSLKTLFRWCVYLVIAFIAISILAALAIRFFVFPNIDQYKDNIADYASQTIDRKISIRQIKTGWDGISPRITLNDVNVYDEQNRPALLLKQIDTELSWLSIGLFDLKLSELTVHAPELMIRRSADGVIYLAGVNLSGRGNPDFANWLLNQSNVQILNANITWLDELRKAPPLSLTNTDIKLTNSAWKSLLGRHQLSAQATPSIGTTKPISLNGYFIGRNMSNVDKWYGEVQAELSDTNLSVWKPWLDYPANLQSGTGSAKAKLHFANKQIDKIEADVQLSQVTLLTPQQPTPLIAQEISGQLGWSDIKQHKTISAKNVNIALNTGIKIKGATGTFATTNKNNKTWIESDFSIGELQLDALQDTLNYFNLPATWKQHLHALSPKGRINALKISFAGEPASPSEYSVSAAFNQLSFQAYQHLPGVTNLTGQINATQAQGELKLNSQQASVDLKNILRWPVPASQLTGLVNWEIEKNEISVQAKSIYISSPHITGTVNADYNHSPEHGDYLDLQGNFDNGNAKFAHFYYPIILGKPTLNWLDTSILEGRANNISVTVKGKLADFPYVNKQQQLDPQLGIFRVTADISQAVLDYGTGWPKIEGLATHMLFEGKRMELNAKKGLISGNIIQSCKVEIPQLDADSPILKINGEIEGPVKQGLQFVNTSPVKEVAMGFTDDLKAAGNGHLHLELLIPMQDLDASKYKGAYLISNGTLFANEKIGLPELSKLNGTLNFTENSLNATNIRTQILGGPAQFSLNTGSDKIIRIQASGRLNDTGIKKLVSHPIAEALHGSSDWKGDIVIKKPLADITLSSNLVGMAVNLPAPFNKSAAQIANLSIEKRQTVEDADNITIKYSELLNAKLTRKESGDAMVIERGEVAINTPAAQPTEKGIHLSAKLEEFDADEWLSRLDDNGRSSSMEVSFIRKADIAIKSLTIFDRPIHQLKLSAQPSKSGIQMDIQSQELTGNVEWRNEQNGKIYARLKQLIIPDTLKQKPAEARKKDIRKLNQQYPALDVIVDSLEVGNKKLGALELNAFEDADSWIIQKLNISNADTMLTADGTWHNWTRNPNTFVNFNLHSENIGKSLKAFGQPDAVKGGKATISGQLHWPGSPHEFETTSLNGTFKLKAEKGQVLKVQPGVGRLLGLLSLQSLPRRLTLDFRDLFSDGFAFDEISATAVATNGVLRSEDFFMTGPAAEASIKGETNLKTETQNLKINVVPHVSDSVSLAALAGGPIVGAAAFVAQKLLKDPFNKIASTEYVITGTWSNPIEVESSKAQEKPASNLPIR